jgi:cytoskeletal protein RodZ
VSIERAAEETRIRADYLMRMESDEFDFLAPAYVRGFIKTYARFLRIKADPLLDEFDRKHGVSRFETQQIVALERHGKQHLPKERRLSRSWSVAAVIAAGALFLLAVVGLVSNPDDETSPRTQIASEDESTPTPTPSPSPTLASPSPEDSAVAFAEGIELEIIGSTHECWVDVTADGTNVFSGMIEIGQSETFTAEKEMDVVLGYAEGVELVINGRDIGSLDIPDVFNFRLPQDFETLL